MVAAAWFTRFEPIDRLFKIGLFQTREFTIFGNIGLTKTVKKNGQVIRPAQAKILVWTMLN